MINSYTKVMGSMELETVACDCYDNKYKLIIESRDLNQVVSSIYQLVQCGRCGLIFQNPRLTAGSMRLCHPSTYESHTRTLSSPPEKTSPWHIRKSHIERANWRPR